MRPTATDAGATRGCDPRVPARRSKMPGPAVMTAEMRVPSPAVTVAPTVTTPMAAAVTAAFWAGQRETR